MFGPATSGVTAGAAAVVCVGATGGGFCVGVGSDACACAAESPFADSGLEAGAALPTGLTAGCAKASWGSDGAAGDAGGSNLSASLAFFAHWPKASSASNKTAASANHFARDGFGFAATR